MVEIKYFKTSELTPYLNNPRKNEKAVDIVAKSIKEFGFLVPIVLDKDKVIVTGHTRLKAAIKLGINEVPTIIADNLTEEQIRAFRIMDNKAQEYAGWDFESLKNELEDLKDLNFDLSLTGFTEANLNRIIEKTPEREDGGKPAKYEMTEGIYQLGENYLICGDCTSIDFSKLLKNEKIQLVYTDPPYGVSYDGHKSETTQDKIGMRSGKDWDVIEGDNLRGDDLFKLLKDAFSNLEPNLAKDAGLYIFHASKNQIIFEQALNISGFEVKQQLIWKKPSVLSHAHYHWAHEPILYCGRKGKNIAFYGDRLNKTVIDNENIETMGSEEMRSLLKQIKKNSTVLEFKKDNASDYIHPTQKPAHMAEYFICNSSKQNDGIVDLFGGSGSTLIACQKKKRRCIIAELDKKYASHIMERWENETNLKGVKL